MSEVAATVGLQRVALFAGLRGDALQAIGRACSWRRFAAGRHIVTRKSRENDVYFVVSGLARATAFSAGGREVAYNDLGPGAVFGELAAIDGKPRSADVLAIEETMVATLSAQAFLALVDAEPAVRRALLVRLAGAVRDLTDRVFDLTTLGVRNRVHAEVLRLAKAGEVRGKRARIAPIPKHGDIASRISTYREQVTRELALLAKLGVLVREADALVVTDLDRLQRLVNEVERDG